jgi:hypothetical protein
MLPFLIIEWRKKIIPFRAETASPFSSLPEGLFF